MKQYLLLLSLFISVHTATAQTYTIRGRIVDAVSRQPLQSATVTNAAMPLMQTFTDAHGEFVLKTGKEKVDIYISYIGFKEKEIAAIGNDELKIELEPDAINLKDVVVLQSSRITTFNTLTKTDLELQPVRNTQELLRLVPGLFIAQHAGGGKAEQIFLRGFDIDHGTDIQIGVDGIPVNMVSHAHGQGYADAHFIIPETINNIDFGTGPYYTQHGNLNTAGYVEFSTYNTIANSRVQLEAGRFNTYRALAMIDLLKKNKDRQSAYIAADVNYTDGPTLQSQQFNRFNFFGKYNLALSANTQLSVSASAFKSRWDASGQIPERAVADGTISRFGSIDPTEGGNTERHNVNFMLNHRFANGTTFENRAFYSYYKFNLYSNFTFFLNDPVNGDEINQAESRNLFGYNARVSHTYNFNKSLLNSVYGAGFRYDASTDNQLSNVVKRQFLSYVQSGDIKETNAYAFMQQQLSLGKWVVEGGIRLDYFRFNYFDKLNPLQQPAQSKAIVSPKLNVQYTFNPNVQAFIKTGKGFHSNDTRVVVVNSGREILPAAYGADAGVILKPHSKLFLTVAAWYLYLDQEFVYVGDAGVIEPGGKTQRQGIDVIARYQITNNLFANFNLNLTRPRALNVPKAEYYIPLAPLVTSTGGIFYKRRQGINGGITYRYIKNRPANEDYSIVAKGYFLVDGAINYTMKKYEVGIAIENALNAKWNEAQFATESRLRDEAAPVDELHFTPGIPFFARLKFAVFF